MTKSNQELQELALKVCVVALLIAAFGFALAYLGYMRVGWWIGILAAIANIASMLTFFIFKLR